MHSEVEAAVTVLIVVWSVIMSSNKNQVGETEARKEGAAKLANRPTSDASDKIGAWSCDHLTLQ